MTEPTCPRCKGPMKQKKGRDGLFLSCLSYPSCKGSRPLPASKSTSALGAVAEPRKPAPPRPLGPSAHSTPLSPGTVAPPSFALDPYQQVVANWREGERCVLASAGSGKTTTLVERTLALLAEGAVPESILLLAYNTDAAETIRERLRRRAGRAADRVNVYTFHAWCLACLRLWYPDDMRFAHGHILDTPGAPHPLKLVEPLLKRLDLQDALTWGSALRYAERVSDELVDLDAQKLEARIALALRWVAQLDDVDPDDVKRAVPIAKFCRAWRDEKREKKLIQFSDMIGEVAGAMLRHPEALGYLRNLYRHVMVDEAQDTSFARAVIARHLGAGASSLLWVGDTQQSIYLFAGARPDILIETAERAGMLPMPVNRRSTKRIIEFANRITKDRDWNLIGDALPKPDAHEGEPVQVWVQKSSTEESSQVLEDILTRTGRGYPLGRTNFVVLARTNALLVEFEYACVARGVPVRVAGSTGGVWGSIIGEELLAYLEGAEGVPTWNLQKVMNKPKRFVKRADLEPVIEAAQAAEKEGADIRLHGRMTMAKSPAVQRFGRDLADLARLPWKLRVLEAARYLGLDDEDDEEGQGGEDRRAALQALVDLAQRLGSLAEIYRYRQEQARGEQGDSVFLSTIHKCVAPETLVEVDGKLLRMDEVPREGMISTAVGVHTYNQPVRYENRAMLRITTRRGYTLTVTEDHGLYAWQGNAYVKKSAAALERGDFLRFFIGAQQEAEALPSLPPPMRGDVREVAYVTPELLTEDVAELLGLIVADGTVFRAGFRFVKRHLDVVDRFSFLVETLFGQPRVSREWGLHGNCYSAEVSSTFLSRWLLSIDGTAPEAKAVPSVVRCAPLRVQAAFLRGLFEDGTVNVKKGKVDHVAWDTKYESMSEVVHTMLLRLGIVSTRARVMMRRGETVVPYWRVNLYGSDAARFRDTIGFISAFKQNRLQTGELSGESQQNAVPVRRGDPRLFGHKSARQNGANRGYLSRDTVRQIGGFDAELAFYHDRIEKIEPVRGPALCVTVPGAGRFLQNGCDGANSKGQEYPVVYVIGVKSEKLPHKKCDDLQEEWRLFYVACTRAIWALTVTTGGKPSKFLRELELVTEEGEEI